jgi:hypothetical protein
MATRNSMGQTIALDQRPAVIGSNELLLSPGTKRSSTVVPFPASLVMVSVPGISAARLRILPKPLPPPALSFCMLLIEAFAVICYAQHDGRLIAHQVHAQVRTAGILHGVVHRFLEDEVEVLALAHFQAPALQFLIGVEVQFAAARFAHVHGKGMHAFDHAGHVVVVGVHGPHDVVHGLEHLRGAIGDAAQQFARFRCFARGLLLCHTAEERYAAERRSDLVVQIAGNALAHAHHLHGLGQTVAVEGNDPTREQQRRRIRNHHVPHHGGVMMTSIIAPRSSHTPALLRPCTRKV